MLIHGHFQRQDQVDAYRRLGVIGSLFPMHTYYWGEWLASLFGAPEGECPGEFFTELAVMMSEGGHAAAGSALQGTGAVGAIGMRADRNRSLEASDD